MTRIAVLSQLDPSALAALRRLGNVEYLPDGVAEHAAASVAEAHVLIVRSNVQVDEAMLEKCRRLQMIVRAGSGLDNIATSACAERGIPVVRVGGDAAARSVAELALCLAIALLRRVPCAVQGLGRGEWLKNDCVGRELRECTVAVWGYGPVGRAVADMFSTAGAAVRVKEHPGVEAPFPVESGAALTASADVHVIALPLCEATQATFGASFVAAVASRAPSVVNVGRWELLDWEVCLDALRRGALSGLAVDPVERRHLAQLDGLDGLNVLATPHIGAMTEDAQRRIGQAVAEAVRGFQGASEAV